MLVKLIDAAQDLSIQVHPNDEFAREHENDNGKTEMWYVLDAVPGATLVHGFAHNVTKDLLREAVRSGTLSKHLQYVPVKKGDVRQKHRLTHYYPGCSRELLGCCEFFELEKMQVTKGFSFTVSENSFQILLCIDGDGGLEPPGLRRPLRFKKGDCLFLPAGLDRYYILGATTLLKIRY